MGVTLELRLKRSERSLERAVSLAGRRGYEIVAVSASLSSDRRWLEVTLTVESERRVESLVHQLEKLFEVDRVSVVG